MDQPLSISIEEGLISTKENLLKWNTTLLSITERLCVTMADYKAKEEYILKILSRLEDVFLKIKEVLTQVINQVILTNGKFEQMLMNYAFPSHIHDRQLICNVSINIKCFMVQKPSYVTTSIKRNWANHIVISHDLLSKDLFEGIASVDLMRFMIVYLSNKHTMNMTSTPFILCSSSGKIQVNIESYCSYTVRIVYLSIHGESGTGKCVSIHHTSTQEVACTHVKRDVLIFRVSELRQLEKKCRSFTQCHSLSPVMKPICYFYRNKPSAYFDNIKENGGDMVPYIKDMSGDPRCPINGRIDGLFFMTNLDRYSNDPEGLPPCSPFGDTRFITPAKRLFNFSTNLYFSDFFCIKDHYVSLVVTKPGSQADLYCQSHLFPMDVYNNPYLRLDISGNVFALHRPGLWVEVMYTETLNVNMPGARWETVRTLGRGESTHMGIPKKAECPHCNLQSGMHSGLFHGFKF